MHLGHSLILLLASPGIQDAMKQLAGGIGNYACGFDQQCEITGALSDACDATPQPVGVLIGMANFNNFFRSVDARINQIRASITNRLPDIANKFVPVDKFAPPPALADKKASLALTAIGTYGALLPGFAGVFARLFSVMSTSVPVIAGQAAPVEFDPDFVSLAVLDDTSNADQHPEQLRRCLQIRRCRLRRSFRQSPGLRARSLGRSSRRDLPRLRFRASKHSLRRRFRLRHAKSW